jgi:hypothetical protein
VYVQISNVCAGLLPCTASLLNTSGHWLPSCPARALGVSSPYRTNISAHFRLGTQCPCACLGTMLSTATAQSPHQAEGGAQCCAGLPHTGLAAHYMSPQSTHVCPYACPGLAPCLNSNCRANKQKKQCRHFCAEVVLDYSLLSKCAGPAGILCLTCFAFLLMHQLMGTQAQQNEQCNTVRSRPAVCWVYRHPAQHLWPFCCLVLPRCHCQQYMPHCC